MITATEPHVRPPANAPPHASPAACNKPAKPDGQSHDAAAFTFVEPALPRRGNIAPLSRHPHR